MTKESSLERLFRIQLNANNIEGFVQEKIFHLTRRWRFDFAWPEIKLAVEIQGGTWSKGRHARGSGIKGDCEKYSQAAILGWRIIFATSEHVRSGEALQWVRLALEGQE